MQEIDVRSDAFADDSSSALNLSHASTSTGALSGPLRTSGGGIAKEFERQLKEHKDAIKAEMERQGVTDPQKLKPVNEGVYDRIERRTREFQAAGYSLVDASRLAREEDGDAPAEPDDREHDRDYLGDSPENLMRAGMTGHMGGGKGNSSKIRRNPETGKLEQVQLLGAKAAGHASSSGGGKLYKNKRSGGSGSSMLTIEPEPRTKSFKGRCSESTATGIKKFQQETGVNIAGILAAVAILHEADSFLARQALATLLAAVPRRRRARRSAA